MSEATAEQGTPNKKVPEYQGFMARQTVDEDELKALEEERANQNNPQNEGEEEEIPDNQLSEEDRTYKKRYGDLRRHQQKEADSYKEKLRQKDEENEKLRQQLSAKVELPATEEELEDFIKERPDVARIFETMIGRRLKEQEDALKSKLDKLEGDQEQTRIERAKVKLMKLHPDLEDLENDPEFHAWVASKSDTIQASIYDNPTDWQSAADAITLYKLENSKPKKTEKKPSAATNVTPRSSANRPSEGQAKALKESEVARWTDVEFEKRQDEIEEAVRAGNFVYDLSGGAR